MKHLQTLNISNGKVILVTNQSTIEIGHTGASHIGTWYAIERPYNRENVEIPKRTNTLAVRMASKADAIVFVKNYIFTQQ